MLRPEGRCKLVETPEVVLLPFHPGDLQVPVRARASFWGALQQTPKKKMHTWGSQLLLEDLPLLLDQLLPLFMMASCEVPAASL